MRRCPYSSPDISSSSRRCPGKKTLLFYSVTFSDKSAAWNDAYGNPAGTDLQELHIGGACDEPQAVAGKCFPQSLLNVRNYTYGIPELEKCRETHKEARMRERFASYYVELTK